MKQLPIQRIKNKIAVEKQLQQNLHLLFILYAFCSFCLYLFVIQGIKDKAPSSLALPYDGVIEVSVCILCSSILLGLAYSRARKDKIVPLQIYLSFSLMSLLIGLFFCYQYYVLLSYKTDFPILLSTFLICTESALFFVLQSYLTIRAFQYQVHSRNLYSIKRIYLFSIYKACITLTYLVATFPW
ncbi:hypothetical protein [Algivirga pacifica]|uniref:hypothetical protein n=1 Tax=Algivirga pacifica TaxID=1162670 RepID=UPI0031E700AB